MAPKGVGPRKLTKAEKKAGFKVRNGMIIGGKREINAKDALAAGVIKQLKKPFTPTKVGSTSTPSTNTCNKCFGTGVSSYSVITKKETQCKDCKGLGWH